MKKAVGFFLGVRTIGLAALLLNCAISIQGQSVFCVRVGATGSNDGSDWYNAFSQLPTSLQRGAIYYLADGSYNGYTFDDAVSGTSVITLKKATIAEHGTETGWLDSYGDGQATFGTFVLRSSYYTFDGATGQGASGHGFYIYSGDNAIYCDTVGVNNITFRHLELEGQGRGGPYGNDIVQTMVYANPGLSNWTWEYCYVHDVGGAMFHTAFTRNWLIQHCYIARNETEPEEHGIGFYMQEVSGLVFRHNTCVDIEGTGVIMIWGSNAKIYGNLMYWTGAGGGTGNGAIGGWSHDHTVSYNVEVYNNTIVNGTGYNSGIGFLSQNVGGNIVRNNLMVNNETAFIAGAQTVDNNTIDNNVTRFVNYNANNFRLTGALAGAALATEFNRDLDGNTRGTDGVWDRGAYDFGGGNSNLTVNAGLDQQITLPENASLVGSYQNLLGGAVSLNWTKASGPGTVSFGSPSSATTTATFSSAGTYILRLAAVAQSVSASDDVIVTVLSPPDNIAPTVTPASPVSGAVVSNLVVLAATASDNVGGSGVAYVTFLVDGLAVGSDSNSPYSVNWDSSTMSNGLYSIQARAVDGAGNQTTSGSVTITVKNAAPTLATGLVGYWGFNKSEGDTTSDSSGNGNKGVLVNGAVLVAGNSAGELSLDGTDDYVHVPTSPSLELPVSAVTVSAWVKLEPNGQWQAIVRKVLQDGVHEFPFSSYDLIVEDAGTLLPRMSVSRADGTRGLVYGNSPISYGQRYHLAGIFDGAAVKLYVDGALAGTTPFSGPLMQTGQPLLIGRNGAGGDILKGFIDDVRIYSRALSAGEIQDLYLSGRSIPAPPPKPSIPGG